MTTAENQPPSGGLQQGVVGLPTVLMQSVAQIAPAVGILSTIAFSTSLAGLGAPSTYLVAFFIALVVSALGALELVRPELLVRGELAHLIVVGAGVFWTLRLIAQPVVFDPVLLPGSRWRLPLRIAATVTRMPRPSSTFRDRNHAAARLRYAIIQNNPEWRYRRL